MDPTLRTILCRFKFGWKSVGPSLTRKGIALIFAFASVALIQKGIADAVEPMLLRGWFGLRGKRPVPQSVSIVRLDKLAYAKINLAAGELFPRQYMAEGLRKISAAGAKLIVIDGVAQRPAADPVADRELAAALAATPTVIARSSEVIVDNDIYGNQHRTKVQNRSLDEFEQNAKAIIEAKVRLTDGVVRELCLSNDRDMFSVERVPLLPPLRQFVTPDIPEPGGFDFINFYGPPASTPSVSFATLIGKDTSVPGEYFKDRVVFIGAMSDSGSGVEAGKDSFLTPISREWMFGVEIHATIAANLMDRSWIRRMSLLPDALMHALLIFCVSLLLLSIGVLPGMLVGISFVGIWFGTAYYLFVKHAFFLPCIVMCGSVFAVLVLRWGLAAFSARRKPIATS